MDNFKTSFMEGKGFCDCTFIVPDESKLDLWLEEHHDFFKELHDKYKQSYFSLCRETVVALLSKENDYGLTEWFFITDDMRDKTAEICNACPVEVIDSADEISIDIEECMKKFGIDRESALVVQEAGESAWCCSLDEITIVDVEALLKAVGEM